MNFIISYYFDRNVLALIKELTDAGRHRVIQQFCDSRRVTRRKAGKINSMGFAYFVPLQVLLNFI